MKKRRYILAITCIAGLLFICMGMDISAAITITDDTGVQHVFTAPPSRIVSLVPASTEIIFALHAEDHLKGITYFSSNLPGAASLPVVGGFLHPNSEKIKTLAPDCIIATSLQRPVIEALQTNVPVLYMETHHLEDAFTHFRMLGALLHKEKEAADLERDNRRQLEVIAQKTAKIPAAQHRRVMRIMTPDKLMVPGDDSFQNELIRAAGGRPPVWGKKGEVITVDHQKVATFNPQAIYFCGNDSSSYQELLRHEGLQSLAAAQNFAIYSFPCELTSRASTHVGSFVSWLSSLLYAEEFSQKGNEVQPQSIIHRTPISLPLPCIQDAEIATSIIHDFANKTLIIDFKSPRSIISTLDGPRDEIKTVGNHYSPPPCWSLQHFSTLQTLRDDIYPTVQRDSRSTSFLFTGADMDNLVIKKEQFRDIVVYALITAGVRGNAVRMSRDTGNYYEPGTINMIFLTNMHLTKRAMARAIISATEGKTAALQDLDIRSSYLPVTAAATGTGTDNIIVVPGDGARIDCSGGHTKMGELLAKAAYAGVTEAIGKQNGIVRGRNIFQRLLDRHLSINDLVARSSLLPVTKRTQACNRLEDLLMDRQFAGFLTMAMALSDSYQSGNIVDLSFFHEECLQVASKIAGHAVPTLAPHINAKTFPTPLTLAINALLTGIGENQKTGPREEQ